MRPLPVIGSGMQSVLKFNCCVHCAGLARSAQPGVIVDSGSAWPLAAASANKPFEEHMHTTENSYIRPLHNLSIFSLSQVPRPRSLAAPLCALALALALAACGLEVDSSKEIATGSEPAAAQAAVTGVMGPGLPNQAWPASDLFKPIGHLNQAQGLPADGAATLGVVQALMHRGYLVVPLARNGGGAGGGLSVWDLADPRNPRMRHFVRNTATSPLREAHGFGIASNDVMAVPTHRGIMFWNVADPLNPTILQHVQVPGMEPQSSYDNGVWWVAAQDPYYYGGGQNHGIVIIKRTGDGTFALIKKIAPGAFGGFKVGSIHAIGNLLWVSRLDGSSGSNNMAVLDIGDPENPVTLDISTGGGGFDYGTFVYGDAHYRPADNRLFIHDTRVPEDVRVSQRTVNQWSGESSMQFIYASFQDGFLHAPLFEHYAKVRMSDWTVVGKTQRFTKSGLGNGGTKVFEFTTPLGNMVLSSGGGDGDGGKLVPHQAEPDTTGPAVMRVVPADGATAQPITTRIGFSLSDLVDVATVDTSAVVVRPVGGEAVPGVFSHQTGMLNFAPAQPLLAGTTYEVVLPAGRLRDLAGNGTPGFTSRFTTRGRAGANTPPSVDAGPEQTVTLPASATLHGSASDDGQPTGKLTTTWAMVSGPAAVDLADTSARETTATFKAAGTYVLRLAASDGALEASDEIAITVQPAGTSRSALLVAGSASLGAADRAIEARLRQLGFTPTIVDDDAVTRAHADGKALVFVSSTVTSGVVGGKLTTVAAPVVTSETQLYDDLGMTGPTAGDHYGTIEGQRSVTANGAVALAGGASGEVALYTSNGALGWGSPSTHALVAATHGARAVLFGYEAGAQMVSGTAPARRVALFLGEADAPKLTANGWRLFDAAITWAAGPTAPINRAPSVDAGRDQRVVLPAAATLAGVVSDDGQPAGAAVGTSWSQLSGPEGLRFSAMDRLDAEVTFPGPGVYTLRLSATDGALEAHDDVVLTVEMPAVSVQISAPPARPLGTAVTIPVIAASGTEPLAFSFEFGDGTPATAFEPDRTATHTYSAPGNYSVIVRVRDAGGAHASAVQTQVVHRPLAHNKPQRSSPILLDETRRRVWTVNPDGNSVACVDADGLVKIVETAVGAHPLSIAQARDGSLWVTNRDAGSVSVLDPDSGAVVTTLALGAGTQPAGIVAGANGADLYLTLLGTGKLVRIDAATRAVVASVDGGPAPWGLATAGDGTRLLVTRFVSPDARGEVRMFKLPSLEPLAIVALSKDSSPDTETGGRGLPNYLTSISVSPDGARAAVPSKKDNIDRGLFRDGLPLTHENTVRAIVSAVDVVNGGERLDERRDLDNSDFPTAVEWSPLGNLMFVALQGNNEVAVLDGYRASVVGRVGEVGLAPQGLVLDPATRRLFVQAFLSRAVTVIDVSAFLDGSASTGTVLASIPVQANERLAPQVLLGKQVFYNAADPRMGRDGYLSCATCHLDGGADGRVWDFTDRGEGLRNTIELRGRRGSGHGPMHWSANFDEVQDFEHDIRGPFGGAGFLTDAQFATGSRNQPLGDRKVGLSPELDALAAYLTSLSEVGHSPHRAPDGSLTPDGAAGRLLFERQGCATCHVGTDFTDSARRLAHDVGTLKPSSGQASGRPLTALDTPTLRGLWSAAPYFHDGSAATLEDVVLASGPAHGNARALNAEDRRQLVAFLLQIDDREPAVKMASGSGEVLFVVGKTSLNTSDSALRARLQQLGFTVTVVGDDRLATAQASGKALVFVSATVTSSRVGAKLTAVATPVVSAEAWLFDDLGMTGATESTHYGLQSGQTTLTITADTALSAGLSGTTPVYESRGDFMWGVPSAAAIVGARSGTRAALFGYDVGATMAGRTAPARRVGLFLSNDDAARLTPGGWSLMEAAVTWAAGGR